MPESFSPSQPRPSHPEAQRLQEARSRHHESAFDPWILHGTVQSLHTVLDEIEQGLYPQAKIVAALEAIAVRAHGIFEEYKAASQRPDHSPRGACQAILLRVDQLSARQ